VAAAVFLTLTTVIVGAIVVGVLFGLRAALPPSGPGPRALSEYADVNSLAVSDNSERAAAAGHVGGRLGRDASIRVWDVRSGRPTKAREFRPRHPAHWMAGKKVGLSPDGQVLAALTCQLEPMKWWLTFFRVETEEVIAEAWLDGPALCPLTFTTDGTAVVFAANEGIVTVRVADGKISVLRPADMPKSQAVYVPALRRVVEVRDAVQKVECELATWDATAERPPTVVPLAGSRFQFDSFAVPRDGRTVVVLNAAGDRKPDQPDLTQYDLKSGQRVSFVRLRDAGGVSSLTEIALTADGGLAAIEDVGRGGLRRSVDVYRVADGVRVAQSLGEKHPGGGRYAYLTTMVPDGSALYFVRESSTIVRLDLQTGQETEN
jgi:hypothetical protein